MSRNGSIVKSTKVFKSQYEFPSDEYAGTKLGIDAEMLKELDRALEGIEGQEYACQCVKEYLFGISHRENRKGLGGSFVFAGAPAVGKTILAERIATCLKRPFLRIDMSTKNDKESSVYELFGIHPSYKAAEEGELTGFVKRNPVSVVLLDEIEKAHVNVLNTLLQVYERGEIMDKFTKKLVNFRDVIIIATTNVGTDIYNGEINKYMFSSLSPATIKKSMQAEINPVTNAPFLSEALVSRFFSGKVIMFNKLRPGIIHKIVETEITKQVTFFEELYGIRMDADAYRIAELLILNQGENADIRALIKTSGEILYKCMERGVQTATDAGSKLLFNKMKLEINKNDACEETQKLLNNKNKSRILVFCDRKDEESFLRFQSERVEIKLVCTSYNFKNMLKDDITTAVIDVDGADTAFSRHLFDYCTKEEGIPTFVYSTKNRGKSFFYYHVENGASECFSPCICQSSLDDFVGGIVGGLDLSYLTKELFRRSKIINYDVDYTFDPINGGIVANIHGLRVENATDVKDSGRLVSERDIPNVSYDDIIGAESAKAELKRASKFVKEYKKYIREGIKIPKGIFLDGEPGTGKTMLAKAFASETKLPFIQKNASEFLIKWIGDGAKAVREMFAAARRLAPCVVFVDEVDVIAKSRVNTPDDNHHTHNITNAFLSEMDGFKENTGAPVFVICASNFSAAKGQTHLDEAFLRRFDKKIHVELPGKCDRLLFLEKELGRIKNSVVSHSVMEQIAKRTVGWSLSDLNSVIQNSLRKYEDESCEVGVNEACLLEELESYQSGEKRKNTEQSVRKTAIHEAGHAIVGNALGIPPVFTTVVSRGEYGGYVYVADEEKSRYTKEELLNKICMALAGRAAEVMELGEDGVNTGASSDLKNASNIAMAMLCDYGMDNSLMCYSKKDAPSHIIEKASRLLENEYERASRILQENRDKLHRVAEILVEKNSLTQDEMEMILKGGDN